ncbi:hypothetical protein BC827DRAFT_1196437 [Russula dissimulans]|nr:hypothetical protein BC827DRAFT_1196437 [Russula dissimulans]
MRALGVTLTEWHSIAISYFPPQDPYQRDDGRGSVPYPAVPGGSKKSFGASGSWTPVSPSPSSTGSWTRVSSPGSTGSWTSLVSHSPQNVDQRDDDHGGVYYRAGPDNGRTSSGSHSFQPVQGSVPPWTTSSRQAQFSVSNSYGTVPKLESPPSAQYHIPSGHSRQVQPYTTQSQVYPSVQGPTYSPGGAPPDRESGHNQTLSQCLQQLSQSQSQYDTASIAQTQYCGPPYQGKQQDYPRRTSQRQSQAPPPPSRNSARHLDNESRGSAYAERERLQPAGSGYSYSRRVKSHTTTTESVSYQSGDYPRADYQSVGSQSVEGGPRGGGGGVGGGGGNASSNFHANFYSNRGSGDAWPRQ